MSDGSSAYYRAPTSTVSVAGARFAYRELGPRSGTPLVLLTHLGANLDGWDPRVVDGLAQGRHLIALEYRGVGTSTGRARHSIGAMGADMVAVIRALGHDRADLFGLSMGGMVAQAVVARAPDLVDRLILASSGPAGGPGLTRMTGVMMSTTLRALATRKDPRVLLFFTRSPEGRRSARDYLVRLSERTAGRDGPVTPGVLRTQLSAVRGWGTQQSADLTAVAGRVLVIHGDSDSMVPPANATELARLIPSSTLMVLPDSGHGAVFQHHHAVVLAAQVFLRR
ncbi:alpha/beta hydrolase [Sanguibacter sp. 25GB23B1]|uniref:alpha/beta fold hydrolase n=1 Tax=unclassified Sanguibacter TaxID=2645534 RepID=UPI0032AFBDC0